MGETLTGTAGNDVFKGYFDGDGATAGTYRDASTVNVTDAVVGGDGTDSLTLTIVDATGAAAGDTNTTATAAQAFAAGFSVSGVEKVTLVKADGTFVNGENNANPSVAVVSTILNSATYAGVKELWQDVGTVGVAENVTVAAGVSAGFKSTGNQATAIDIGTDAVEVVVGASSATQKTLAVALDGVADTYLEFAGAGVDTVTVSGSITDATGTVNLLELGEAGAVNIKTINLGLTTASTVDISEGTWAKLTTVDASSSTGAITTTVTTTGFATANAGTLTVKGGSGADQLTLQVANATANALATNVTLNAGADKVTFATAGGNINANPTTAAELTANLVTITDFAKAEDVLDFSAFGPRVAQNDVNGAISALSAADQADLFKVVTAVEAKTTAGVFGTATYAVFQFGSDTYLYANDANAGLDAQDTLVKLTGVAVADLTSANFVA